MQEAKMNTNELFGKEVLDANANIIGKVSDIDFDLIKGTIHHIIVKAGLIKKYVISLEKIDRLGDKLTLRITEDELARKS